MWLLVYVPDSFYAGCSTVAPDAPRGSPDSFTHYLITFVVVVVVNIELPHDCLLIFTHGRLPGISPHVTLPFPLYFRVVGALFLVIHFCALLFRIDC